MILYELFTNVTPFEREQVQSYSDVISHLNHNKRPTIPTSSKIPAVLLQIIQKCWDTDDTKRPRIDEIIIKLESLLQSNSSLHPPIIENHVINEVCSYYPSELWIKPFFECKTVQEVEPLLGSVINLCYRQFKQTNGKLLPNGKVMFSMRLLCKQLV